LEPEISMAQRYRLAQAALCADKNIVNGGVFPTWIDEDTFWYERRGSRGPEYRVVDARDGSTRATVCRAEIASCLSALIGAGVETEDLVLRDPQFDPALAALTFSAYGDSYAFELGSRRLRTEQKKADINWLASPDGTRALVLRACNLWLRDVETGTERPLTTDGTELFAYGDVPAAMRVVRSLVGDAKPEALWSPDGKWVLTLQTDDRHVPELAVIDYAPVDGLRPVVSANRTSLPADPKVTEFRIVAIEAESGRQVEARYPRLAAVRMNTPPFSANLAWWSADARTAYFVDLERGEKAAHVVAFDLATGQTSIVFSEYSDTYLELSVNIYTRALLHPLPETNELIWYSERTGRGHFYLYDLASGNCRNAITSGEWQVRELLRVDSERREIIFLAGGIAADENPYICKPCIASFDGRELTVLSDAPGEHRIWSQGDLALMLKQLEGLNIARVSGLSPATRYFVETVSQVDEPPETWLRRRDGSAIARLETAKGELPAGWQWPEPVTCKAADGETDIYGLLFKPLGWRRGIAYPLIDLIYGGPQINYVPHCHFADGGRAATSYLDAAHLAAIGAYVLILDGRGTANREQAFRTASHGAAQDASNLADHVAAIRQLADRGHAIDLDRIGITGFSGGGYMAAHAALRFGDFFKVAVAGGGNYDQALFWHSWGERYHGPYAEDHYAPQAAKTYAEGLTGKLMLMHGLQDAGCHPGGLFQLVQALVDANKDFDLVLVPRAAHDWTGYGLRRRLDFFVEHLIGEKPPAFPPLERSFDLVRKRAAASMRPPEKQK
jgi:dipeptidyl-peptidase-4